MHEYEQKALKMVNYQLHDRGVTHPAVLDAMLRIPRHEFVRGLDPRTAYEDRALPTAEGQTISQPYMVGLMTELLGVKSGLNVLEIGTGSGYQTAVLAHMGARVVSIEQRPTLARSAQKVLAMLGYAKSVKIIVSDGTLGHYPMAPYDRILVTAAAPHLPSAYRTQLANRGRIIIPLGDRTQQRLTLLSRHDTDWSSEESVRCRFVPLKGADGWPP